jgi:drug/metabolite transporter (DMT)-like permease
VTPKEFILLLLSVLASVSGQVLLKAGALRLGRVNPKDVIGYIMSIFTTPELIAGLTCYGLGAFIYILLLTRVKLSVAAPSIALVYVVSVIMGYFLFKESIPVSRLVGLGFIVCGVLLVLWQK